MNHPRGRARHRRRVMSVTSLQTDLRPLYEKITLSCADICSMAASRPDWCWARRVARAQIEPYPGGRRAPEAERRRADQEVRRAGILPSMLIRE
jgi:hypothetical protein